MEVPVEKVKRSAEVHRLICLDLFQVETLVASVHFPLALEANELELDAGA